MLGFEVTDQFIDDVHQDYFWCTQDRVRLDKGALRHAILDAISRTEQRDTSKVSRVVVIGPNGSEYERRDLYPSGVYIDIQDDGRTLKIFPILQEGVTAMQSNSVFQYHRPKSKGVNAVRVTRDNAEAVAKEVGGTIEEQYSRSDPSDVAQWIVVPTLAGIKRLLVGSGPVVGRDILTGKVQVWSDYRDFYAEYEENTR